MKKKKKGRYLWSKRILKGSSVKNDGGGDNTQERKKEARDGLGRENEPIFYASKTGGRRGLVAKVSDVLRLPSALLLKVDAPILFRVFLTTSR